MKTIRHEVPAYSNQQARQPLPTLSLMVIDTRKDMVRLQKTISTWYEHIACHIDVCFDPRQALKLLQTQDYRYHLILIEYHIPGLSLPDFTRAVREHDDSICIVAMSDGLISSSELKVIQESSDFFLPKPINPRLLRKIVHI